MDSSFAQDKETRPQNSRGDGAPPEVIIGDLTEGPPDYGALALATGTLGINLFVLHGIAKRRGQSLAELIADTTDPEVLLASCVAQVSIIRGELTKLATSLSK